MIIYLLYSFYPISISKFILIITTKYNKKERKKKEEELVHESKKEKRMFLLCLSVYMTVILREHDEVGYC